MVPRAFAFVFVAINLGAAGCGDSSLAGGSAGDGAGGETGGGPAGGSGQGACAVAPELIDTDREIEIAADPGSPLGVFDPSLSYLPGADSGAMSYSSVASSADIHTRIATSSDEGLTWTFAVDANEAQAGSVAVTNDPICIGSCSGTFIHEVSSLIEDATDPDADRRFKLFSHRYLVAKVQDENGQPVDVLRYDIGHIALQTAAAPQGPWTTSAAMIGWAGTSPFSQSGVPVIATDEPDLADCIALTEPGAIATEDGLYLALGCATAESTLRIVLFFSDDHAASWSYKGLLLDSTDAACLGGDAPSVNAADLVEDVGEIFLIATPSSVAGDGTIYRGCSFIPVADLSTATIERQHSGEPEITLKLDRADGGFVGACAYASGATQLGILAPFASLDSVPVFHIGQAPPLQE